MLPFEGAWAGGWRVGGILNARSGVPINVTINRPTRSRVGGVTVTNVPGGNTRGTQRPDLVPGVNPYLKDGVRWLNPAAFAAPLPGTFGNLPRNYLRGPDFWQLDLMTSARTFRFAHDQGIQFRVDLFNITNRLNYENPAAALPAGTIGQPFTDAVAGTFGYMLGPLNRTVGLGTARQTQIVGAVPVLESRRVAVRRSRVRGVRGSADAAGPADQRIQRDQRPASHDLTPL